MAHRPSIDNETDGRSICCDSDQASGYWKSDLVRVSGCGTLPNEPVSSNVNRTARQVAVSVGDKVHAGEQLIPTGITVEAFVLGVRHHIERPILALLLVHALEQQ